MCALPSKSHLPAPPKYFTVVREGAHSTAQHQRKGMQGLNLGPQVCRAGALQPCWLLHRPYNCAVAGRESQGAAVTLPT